MAEANLEIYRRMLEAFNREGVDGVLEFFDEAVEVYDPDLPGDRPYRGHDGVRHVSEQLMSGFKEVRVRNSELYAADDRVVAVLHTFGRGQKDEIEIEMRDAHTATFRDGKIVHWRLYLDPDEALADAGLSAPEE